MDKETCKAWASRENLAVIIRVVVRHYLLLAAVVTAFTLNA